MISKSGVVSKEPDGYQVIFERHFNYDAATIWDAVTNPQKMRIWFLETEMELKKDARMTIRFNDEENTVTYGRITEVDPQKLFEYVWENPDGPDEITRWEIIPKGSSSCTLILTDRRIDESYASRVPAGWHIMLNHLEEVLTGKEEIYSSGDRNSDEEKTIKAFYKDLVEQTITIKN